MEVLSRTKCLLTRFTDGWIVTYIFTIHINNTQHTLVWTNTGEWEVQVRIEDENKIGEGSLVYLMIEEQRLESIIKILSAVCFLVEILTSLQVLEKKKNLLTIPK